MISLIGSSSNHTLLPALDEKHKETLNWLSSIKLWKKELAFFQTILDGTAHYFTSPEDKKKVSHFQNLIMYYHAEVLVELRTKLRNHESHLFSIMTEKNVSDSLYYQEHESIMSELKVFSESFAELKSDFFKFVEKLK